MDNNHDCSSFYLEPIQPIHIQAPQPTLVLQSDYNRLRAELNSRVRPPGSTISILSDFLHVRYFYFFYFSSGLSLSSQCQFEQSISTTYISTYGYTR